MILRQIAQILSYYLFYLSSALLIPLALALYYQWGGVPHPQPHATEAFFYTLLISLALALALKIWGRSANRHLYRREGILLVVLIWGMTSLISSLPFALSGTLKPLDAYFEALSGLTTTGASVMCAKAYNPATGAEVPILLTNPHVPDTTYVYYGTIPPIRDAQTHLITHSGVEAVSRALLFWRSLLQWIGGMGIVVIFLTVLPALGVGGKFLYQMETTGPIKDEITPRIQETASRLWKLYLGLTVLEIGLLLATNHSMPLFDAVCISLSNISTGGFSVRNDSIASYHSAATEWIVLLFMIAGSINFALYFQALRLRFSRTYVPDFILFLIVIALGCIAVSLFLIHTPVDKTAYSFLDALRFGSFQAVSMQTSTGFVTANYDRWPFPCQMWMLILMFVGGMSGSTAGGIKTSRFYILYKIVLHRLESIYRPDTVRLLRIGNTPVDDKSAQTVLSFFCIIAFFALLGTVCFILDGIDPETSLGLVACFLNNVGAAFRAAGPTDSFAFLPIGSKLFSLFWMLLGRLEFFIVLLLFLPAFWKNR